MFVSIYFRGWTTSQFTEERWLLWWKSFRRLAGEANSKHHCQSRWRRRWVFAIFLCRDIKIRVFYLTAFNLFIFTISGLTTCLVIDRYSYKQLISNKFTIPDYKQVPKKVTVDNEFKALRLRDLRIVATLGVGGKLESGSNVVKT